MRDKAETSRRLHLKTKDWTAARIFLILGCTPAPNYRLNFQVPRSKLHRKINVIKNACLLKWTRCQIDERHINALATTSVIRIGEAIPGKITLSPNFGKVFEPSGSLPSPIGSRNGALVLAGHASQKVGFTIEIQNR